MWAQLAEEEEQAQAAVDEATLNSESAADDMLTALGATPGTVTGTTGARCHGPFYCVATSRASSLFVQH